MYFRTLARRKRSYQDRLIYSGNSLPGIFVLMATGKTKSLCQPSPREAMTVPPLVDNSPSISPLVFLVICLCYSFPAWIHSSRPQNFLVSPEGQAALSDVLRPSQVVLLGPSAVLCFNSSVSAVPESSASRLKFKLSNAPE